MKWPLLVLSSCVLVLASCETGEVTTSSDFDPLLPPGAGRSAVAKRTGYKPGSFVRTSMDNVAFFSKRPKGDVEAEKQLAGNTEMKVISDDGNYVKGELNSGEVGFVLSVQVTDGQAGVVPMVGSGNEFQVYPPAPGGVPPVIDPNVPTIPPVIDPNATAPIMPDVPAVPELENPTTPPVPLEPTPLPPGNEAEPGQ